MDMELYEFDLHIPYSIIEWNFIEHVAKYPSVVEKRSCIKYLCVNCLGWQLACWYHVIEVIKLATDVSNQSHKNRY